ncbi:stage 0 sporulation protein, partial [bacterium]|nr:stage 0 sporulation protein [bacterium]
DAEEKSAFKTVNELVAVHGTPLKLAKVCFTFEKRRIFVYYTANARVDFRALIKDINSRLHTHVQMAQVSPIECARIIGGLGVCGRPFCCTLFGKCRGKVSRGASQKALGPCGKTLCCHQIKE